MMSQAPPRPRTQQRVSLLGLSYTLDVNPAHLSGCEFDCPGCHARVFDGGIPKQCVCRCGRVVLRSEDMSICSPEKIRTHTFDDQFRVRTHVPPAGQIPQLASVTFGLFDGSGFDPDTALRSVLLPFTMHRERCYGINDLVECGGLRFKVLAAEPLYGVARAGTKVQCYTVLHAQAMAFVKVAAVYPKQMTQQDFQTVTLQFVIIEANPSDGFVTAATQLVIEPRPLEGMRSIVFTPNLNTLPPEYLPLQPQQLQAVLLDGYLRPYFFGWHRHIRPSEQLRFGNIELTAVPGSPNLGFVGSLTSINIALPPIRSQMQIYQNGHMVTYNVVGSGAGQMNPALFHHLIRLSAAVNQGPVRAPPRTTMPTIIAALPVRTLSVPPEDFPSCTVCMCDYEAGEQLKSLPCCKFYSVHEYHSACIDEWLNRSELCPLCKANVPEAFMKMQAAQH